MFGNLKKAVTEIGNKIVDETNKFQEKINSIDPNDIVDPGHKFGPLWEPSERVEYCRECRERFQQLVKRKHHCRDCASVYCNKCCPVDNDKSFEDKRICLPCKRGENLSEELKTLIRQILEVDEVKSSTIEKFQSKVIAKVSESLSEYEESTSVHILTKRGSLYPDDNVSNSSSTTTPVSGYFEFFNKSNEVCCLKLLIRSEYTKFEIARPSYIAVPPQGYVHALFDPKLETVDLIILYGNENKVPSSEALVYDTKATGVTADLISKCAKVNLFKKLYVYTIQSKGKNILLKYKGDGRVIPREGDSIGRVGFIPKIQGKRFSKDKIDYSTNINLSSLSISLSLSV